jgi:SAM-dependent methyltransferase
MHARGIAQGKELATLLDLSETIRVLDVGGGSGAFTFAFLEKNPAITGVIFDLPNVVPVTQKYIDRAGYNGVVTTLRGDYLQDDFGTGFDLVLMSAIIHINNPAENRLLIRKGAEALREGGQLVIIDHVMNDDRTEPFAGAMFTLNMVAGTKHGDTYTEQEFREWMRDAGLAEVRLMTAPSGMQVMTGNKIKTF